MTLLKGTNHSRETRYKVCWDSIDEVIMQEPNMYRFKCQERCDQGLSETLGLIIRVSCMYTLFDPEPRVKG